MPDENTVLTCPKCGKEFDGVECKSCGYVSENGAAPCNNAERDAITAFPQNNATTSCYVAAIILAAAAVLFCSSLSIVFTLIIVGIACIIAGLGKGIQILHLALEAIYDVAKQNQH